MPKKRLWIALLAVPICFASLLVISAQKSNLANAGGIIDPTCTSSLPCIEYDNTSTGPGMKGTSAKGRGVVGVTTFNSTSSSSGTFGVFGNDLSTSGFFDAGVKGLSVRGTGVVGTSTSGIGVEGVAVTSGTAVEADSSLGNAIEAHTTSGYVFYSTGGGNPAFIVDSFGNTITAGDSFVENGLAASGPHNAVVGETTGTDSSAGGIVSQTDNPQSWIFRGYSVFHHAYTFLVTDDGTVFAKGYGTLSAARTLQKTSTGETVNTYAPQISQPTLEDVGEAQLINGVANVALEPKFASAIDRNSSYLVTVTPEGECRGLYVALRSRAGFVVRELQGGRSSLAFAYRIVARPFGDTSARLPVALIPRGFTPNSERPPQRSLPHRP